MTGMSLDVELLPVVADVADEARLLGQGEQPALQCGHLQTINCHLNDKSLINMQ